MSRQAQQEPYLLPPKYARRAREIMRDLQQSSVQSVAPDLQTRIMWFKLLDVQVLCLPQNACRHLTPSSLQSLACIIRHCRVSAGPLANRCIMVRQSRQ